MRELTHNILIESPLPATGAGLSLASLSSAFLPSPKKSKGPATRRGLWVYGRAAVSAASKPFMLGDLALQADGRYDAAD